MAALAPPAVTATARDVEVVAEQLGRSPQGDFDIVLRTAAGTPVVLRNAPLLHDGTPMPTRYWLADPALRAVIGTLESHGGVRRAEVEIDAFALEQTHRVHADERDAAIPDGHTGPRPSGGVGGTRQGVKCLHAHYANWLAGADDPVGAWVHEQLRVDELMPLDVPERVVR